MIITLRNHFGVEIDMEWEGPRANLPPVYLMYDGRLFWRTNNTMYEAQGEEALLGPATYREMYVDDVSMLPLIAKRNAEGQPEMPSPGPAEIHPTTDEDELMEVD